MLSELFERLPEVGDPGQAGARVLLRRSAPAVRRRAGGAGREDRAGRAADPIEGRRRVLRHPEPARTFRTTVLGQLGNRVQHALRAFTPSDQKAVKAAADTLRPNPTLDIASRDHRARGGRGARLAARRQGAPRRSPSAPGLLPPASQIGPITDGGARRRSRRQARQPSTATTSRRSIANPRTRS